MVENSGGPPQLTHLVAALTLSPDATVVSDASGRVVGCNEAFRILFGAELQRGHDLRGDPLLTQFGLAPAIEAVHAGEPQKVTRFSHRPGNEASGPPRTLAIELTLTPVRQPVGQLLGVISQFREVPREVIFEMQRKLELTDRLVSLGTLAAGMAHEINNPLAFVISNVMFAAQELAPARRANADLDDLCVALAEACEGANRIRNIVRDLKAMSRQEDEAAMPVDLHAPLDAAVTMMTSEVRHRTRVVKEYGAIPRVQGIEGRLMQIFLNLLLNAAQAMPAEREGVEGVNEIRVRSSVTAEGRVAVEIQDNGCGIPRENLRRIFDPFFTTKPVGVGTGLGLHLCHKFVAAMGGEILVSSEPGAGTTFRLTFKRADQEESKAVPLPIRAA